MESKCTIGDGIASVPCDVSILRQGRQIKLSNVPTIRGCVSRTSVQHRFDRIANASHCTRNRSYTTRFAYHIRRRALIRRACRCCHLQTQRLPYDMPTLHIDRDQDGLMDVKLEEIVLEKYRHHPVLRAKML